MIIVTLNFLLLCSAAWSCDCKLVDAMAQLVLTDIGNSVELPCDVPTTWPDSVTVTWTKYPAEKLSSALAILVNDSRYSVMARANGEFNLKIFNVNMLDDGKYYCKFSFGEGQDTSIIKVYRLQVNQAPERNSSRSDSESKRGRRNSGSSRGKSDSRRVTSPQPTSAPSRWRNISTYNSSTENRRTRPDSSWIKNSTNYYSSTYNWRRNTTARPNGTMWTRNSSYNKYSTRAYETLSWWKNKTASNTSTYDSRRNSSRSNGTSWTRNSTYGNSSRDYKPSGKPVSTASWSRNNTAYYTSGSNNTGRQKPGQPTTTSWRSRNATWIATRWTTKASTRVTVPAKTTARTTMKFSASRRTIPSIAISTTKVPTTLRRSSRLSQTSTVATTRSTPSRTTTKKSPRGKK